MAPIGVIGICAQDGHGDLATARAAARTGVPMVASTLTVDPLEEVAAAFGDTPGFFQLYTPTDRELAASLVQRAEAAGFKGIVVTLDTWVTGWRPRDLRTSNFPQLRGHCLANYTSDPVFRASLQRPPEEDPQGAVLRWIQVFGNPLTWDDLPWLRSLTDLPLLVKGICHPDDARRAKDGGVDGIYCSNHGGRQANGGLPAIDCLPGVVEAADGLPVLFDSGIRSGADVIKALALGATAVGVGRPYAYGLALGGVDGIVHVLRSLLAEADLIMAVDGYPTRKDLTPDTLAARRLSRTPRRLRPWRRGGDPRRVRRVPRAAMRPFSAHPSRVPGRPALAVRVSRRPKKRGGHRPGRVEPAGPAVVAGRGRRSGGGAHDAGPSHLGGQGVHRMGGAARPAHGGSGRPTAGAQGAPHPAGGAAPGSGAAGHGGREIRCRAR